MGSALRSERPGAIPSQKPMLRPIVDKAPTFSPEEIYKILSSFACDWRENTKKILQISAPQYVKKSNGVLSISNHPSGLDEFSLGLRYGSLTFPKSNFGIAINSGSQSNQLVYINLEKGMVIRLNFERNVWTSLESAITICAESATKENPVFFDNGHLSKIKKTRTENFDLL